MAQQLNLTHFVDISPGNLKSANSIEGCRCVHFVGDRPRDQHSVVDQLGFGPYPVASDWDQLLQLLLQS